METTIPQTKQCPYCGEVISINAHKCWHCGEWLSDAQQDRIERNAEAPYVQQYAQPAAQPQVVVKQVEHRSNGIGTAGFVLTVISTVLFWFPIANIVLWLLGFIFSFVGLFKRPIGIAIAGFIISIIDFFIICIVFDSLLS